MYIYIYISQDVLPNVEATNTPPRSEESLPLVRRLSAVAGIMEITGCNHTGQENLRATCNGLGV